MKSILILCLFTSVTLSFGQKPLNDSIRKKMEAGKPTAEVIQEAEAAAMKIGGKPLTNIVPGKSTVETSQVLNERLRLLEANWKQAGFSVKVNDDGAVAVVTVDANSAAAKAGVLPGDTLKKVSGNVVEGLADFLINASGQPKKEVDLTISRGGKDSNLKLSLPVQDKPGQGTGFEFKGTLVDPDKQNDNKKK